MAKSIITLLVIFLPVFALTYVAVWYPKISRQKYSLFTSFSMGLQLFLLSAIYNEGYIGLFLFLFALPVGYLVTYYYLYFEYEKRFNKYSKYKS